MLGVSAVFTFAGMLVVLAVLWMTARGAYRAASPAIWADRYQGETYVHFAWQELGRGLFLGYLFALGLTPTTAFFFLGSSGNNVFWQDFFFNCLINWGVGAIAIYLIQLLPGISGFLRYMQQTGGPRSGLSIYLQFLIVAAMSAPLVYVFIVYLLPPAGQIFRVLIETLLLYFKIVL
jgi:hypothetical protein